MDQKEFAKSNEISTSRRIPNRPEFVEVHVYDTIAKVRSIAYEDQVNIEHINYFLPTEDSSQR
jgi:hypothetical protein